MSERMVPVVIGIYLVLLVALVVLMLPVMGGLMVVTYLREGTLDIPASDDGI